MDYWYWFIAAAMLAIIEMAIPITFCLWLSVSCAVMGVGVLLVPTLPVTVQLITFALMTLISVGLTMRYKGKLNDPKTPKILDLNNRTTQWIGHVITLEQPIIHNKGHIQLGGSIWTIQGPNAPAGTVVKLLSCKGNEFIVDLIDPQL